MDNKSLDKGMQSAKITITLAQKIFFVILLVIILVSFVYNWRSSLVTLIAIITAIYFLDLVVSITITLLALFKNKEIKITKEQLSANFPWPRYTILCPLYKEEKVIEQYIHSIDSFDYPKEKLECLLLLEADDTTTYEKIISLDLPPYFKVIRIPDTPPKTKPKACNVGLQRATGKYLVIYDAEDIPDPDQLKKAVLAFEEVDERVICIQGKLNFYHRNTNLLTRFFTSEYSLWFDLELPGLQLVGAPIPLGGTSNHFITERLKEIGGWDPFNVTEDCDLGIRVAKEGWQTQILDSTTWEEPNSKLVNWVRQRSRWTKGYLQTFLVNTRNPLKLIRQVGLKKFLFILLLTGFKPLSSLINPLFWVITIIYFSYRQIAGPVIEPFYPGAILYFGVFALFFGNFFFAYSYLIGSGVRGHYDNIKLGLLMPFYWLLMSLASWYGVIQLFVHPHYWEKTHHGIILSEATNE